MKIILGFVTALTCAAMLVGGCVPGATSDSTAQQSGSSLPMGTIELRVTDAPPQQPVDSIMVTVSSVEIHKAVAEQEQVGEGEQNQIQQQEQQGEGEWLPLGILDGVPNPFDLLLLRDQGLEQILAIGEVEEGKYTQIRIIIDKVEVAMGGGPLEEAKLPSNELKIVRPFIVVDGETTELLVDFDAERSLTVTGQGSVIVKPVVKLSITHQDKPHELVNIEGAISDVDTELGTVSIIPTGETEAIVLDVTPQTEVTLDGEEATLDELVELVGTENSVVASYYLNTMKATQVNAQSQGAGSLSV